MQTAPERGYSRRLDDRSIPYVARCVFSVYIDPGECVFEEAIDFRSHSQRTTSPDLLFPHHFVAAQLGVPPYDQKVLQLV